MFTKKMQSLFFALIGAWMFVACTPQNAKVAGQDSPATATDQNPRNLKWNPADTTWTEQVLKSDDEWKQVLTAEEFEITRRQGTEYAFSSPLYEVEDKGMYYCTCCANPLFRSETKFHSGTGWPSYWKPYATKSVATTTDNSHGMVRVEVHCARCEAHLGHVFDDGPRPTGLRYCMDGVALHFEKDKK